MSENRDRTRGIGFAPPPVMGKAYRSQPVSVALLLKIRCRPSLDQSVGNFWTGLVISAFASPVPAASLT